MRKRDNSKKIRIMNSAVSLIAETGIAGLSMSKLAKASGVPQSTIYVYFDVFGRRFYCIPRIFIHGYLEFCI